MFRARAASASTAQNGSHGKEAGEACCAFHDAAGAGELISREAAVDCVLRGLAITIPEETVLQLVGDFADGKDGQLSLDAFESFVFVCRLREVFDEFDNDRSGDITSEELREALNSFENADPAGKRRRSFSQGEVDLMLSKADVDRSGSVNWAEFRTFFSGRLDRRGSAGNLRQAVASAWTELAGADTGSDLHFAMDDALSSSWSSVWPFLVAGGLGGIVSRTATAPFERLKITAQTGELHGSLVAEVRAVVAREGLRGLFAGNAANVVRVFPFAGTVCLCYANLVETFVTGDPRYHVAPEPVLRGMCGAAAGAVATCSTYPLDLIRTRMTVHPEQFPSMKATVAGALRTDGWRGLWRGLSPTLMAMAPFVAIQQASYDWLKQRATDRSGAFSFEPGASVFMACGVVAGATAQTVVYPIDVVRRRMQLHSQSRSIETALRVVGTEGVRGLYRGLTPTFAKVGPAVAISLTVRDIVRDMLGR
jgi:solute carrier family 25 (mitochondrial phosphate transporter), member 23/24/25/41